MSFIGSSNGIGFDAGRFLVDDELCVRVTKTIAANHAQVVTRADGTKYVPAGAVIPSNNSSAEGILYEDIDVTKGAAAGSVVIEGTIYLDQLPADLQTAAANAMPKIRTIATKPTVTRPY